MVLFRLMIRTLGVTLLLLGITLGQDWAKLNHYKEANWNLAQSTPNPNRVVFMGNSITESWIKFDSLYFANNAYVNRGISGQTSPQMLLRFRSDVLALNPAVVIILAGTNDIAGNTGPITPAEILGNIATMAELAKSHNVEVVLCSILPAESFPWKPDIQPAEQIVIINQMIQEYSSANNVVYLDYYSAVVNEKKGFLKQYSYDGVHPNLAGYHIMERLVEQTVSKVLSK